MLSDCIPPSVNWGISTTVQFDSLLSMFAKKLFLYLPTVGFEAAASPWNLTDLPWASLVDSAGVPFPRNALSASRKELCDSPSSNYPSSKLPPGFYEVFVWGCSILVFSADFCGILPGILLWSLGYGSSDRSACWWGRTDELTLSYYWPSRPYLVPCLDSGTVIPFSCLSILILFRIFNL